MYSAAREKMEEVMESPLTCSFCEKSEQEVKTLTANSATVSLICDECVALNERVLIKLLCGEMTFGQLLTAERMYPEDILRLTVGEFFDRFHTLVMKRLPPKTPQ